MSNNTIATQSGTPAHTPVYQESLLALNDDVCNTAIGRREFNLRHYLEYHPLLSLNALARLAEKMTPASVECHKAKQAVLVPEGCEDVMSSFGDCVRNIESNGRWMALWNIEQVREYSDLLDILLDEVRPLLPTEEGLMVSSHAVIFISSPKAVTPAHFDPEHNFLLQIRGRKHINVGYFPDRRVARNELARYHAGGHRNLTAIPPCSNFFNIEPGQGVYLYPWAPHWVYNGPSVSVSLSLTFHTSRSELECIGYRNGGDMSTAATRDSNARNDQS
ncbi:MAG: hypothetical protein WDZ76_09580 [Pseudohongiellaceae bacterium]